MGKKLKDKKIELDLDDNSNGIVYGALIGSVIGILLTLVFEVDMAYAYGIMPGMVLGLMYDIWRSKNKKAIQNKSDNKKTVTNKTTKKTNKKKTTK